MCPTLQAQCLTLFLFHSTNSHSLAPRLLDAQRRRHHQGNIAKNQRSYRIPVILRTKRHRVKQAVYPTLQSYKQTALFFHSFFQLTLTVLGPGRSLLHICNRLLAQVTGWLNASAPSRYHCLTGRPPVLLGSEPSLESTLPYFLPLSFRKLSQSCARVTG
jgi:hypothetical protein